MRKAGIGVAAQQVWELESKLNGLRPQSGTLRRKLITSGLTQSQIDQLLVDHQPVTTVPIKAPFGGTVVNFEKVLGQAALAHEALFEIHDTTRPLIRGFVSERDAGRVRIGQSLRARLVADPDLCWDWACSPQRAGRSESRAGPRPSGWNSTASRTDPSFVASLLA